MIVTNGSTNVSTYFVLRDATTHAPKTDVALTDIDLYYVEQGAAISAKADITEALAAADSAHADNKAYHVGQGIYRIDWPDAAFDGGVGTSVILIVVYTGVDTTFLEVELSPNVNVASMTDAVLKSLGVVAYGTAQAGGNTSIQLAAATSFANDIPNSSVVYITGGTGFGQSRSITDWDSASDTATVDTWVTNPDNTSTYVVLAAPPASTTAVPAVNVTQVIGSATAGNNAGAFFDGTGYTGGALKLQTNVVAISDDVDAADNLELACDGTGYNLGGGDVVAASVTAGLGTVALKKNTALAKFPFVMRDSTNHAPAEGLTVTATRSIDGAAFAGGTLSAVTEVASGVYYVDFGAGDLNGNTIVLKCTAAASDTTFVSIVTNP